MENNFNVRGGLGMLIQPFQTVTIYLTSYNVERLTFHATMEKVVPNKGSVQEKLNELAQTSDFKLILREEVKEHNLVLEDVQKCVDTIYHEASKYPHGNTWDITFSEDEFTSDELVVLTSFFRLQSKWGLALHWKVVWRQEV